MTRFNRWLSQQDSFVASEMRIKVRYISFERNESKLKLTWGVPDELMRTFDSQLHIVKEQLAIAGGQLSPPISTQTLSGHEIELSFVLISQESPEVKLESLTEYANRKVAITATSQIGQELESKYVGRYLDHFGGQVVYVVPQALNR